MTVDTGWTVMRFSLAEWLVKDAHHCTVNVSAPQPHHNHFTALFLGPPGWACARRELLDFMVQGKINRGRHTDHPAGRHSIRTNQCHHPPFNMSALQRYYCILRCSTSCCWLLMKTVYSLATHMTIIIRHSCVLIHCESKKKGATLTMAITLSILDQFAKFFHCCKQQEISYKTNIRLPITP